MTNPSLVTAAKVQLCKSSSQPCDTQGYVPNVTDNLLPGVRLEQFESDLRKGGGHELDKKFRALHSSSALAINTFAPFKTEPTHLPVLSREGFESLVFEKQLPTGLRGTPPNLDVFLQREHEVVAIESKFLEYCSAKEAVYSDSYSRKALPLAEDSWWEVLEESKRGQLQHLDVAQLVKHYLGLVNLIAQEKFANATLLYLFWEPVNWRDFEECRTHRREIEALASKVRSSRVHFRSLSYLELWESWEGIPSLASHVEHLKSRYRMTLDCAS